MTVSEGLSLRAYVAACERACADLPDAPLPVLLLRARLADAFRDAHLAPPLTASFGEHTEAFEVGDWYRLSVLTLMLDHVPDTLLVVELTGGETHEDLFVDAFASLARALGRVEPETLRESALRKEELARNWLLRLGLRIAGETPEQSMAELDRLDYSKTLSLVEEAQAQSEERQKYLRKLQERAEQQMRPRGKW